MQTYIKSLNTALHEAMENNPLVYVLGEDILDPYGGAFKVTKGLSTRFPDRVLTTPISEGAIVGIAAGMAMRGLLPVVEIMFGDFLTLCCDQIVNHIAKFRWMYNNQVQVPLVIRTPMGGYRGYGPTHSQTLEKLFFGVPGLSIVAPSHLHNPGELLKRAIEDLNPVLFIENKLLYGRKLGELGNADFQVFTSRTIDGTYPDLLLSNNNFEGAMVTIMTYGGTVPFVLEAASELLIEEEAFIEICVPSCIKPFKIDHYKDSINKTGRVIIVEEGTLSCGWGAEMGSRIHESNWRILKAPVKRVAALDLPIANTQSLERKILPGKESIKQAIREMVQFC